MKVENATLLQEPGRSLVILRGEPSKAPDLARKASASMSDAESPRNSEAASTHASLDRPRLIVMGAMVYGPTLSHAQWPHPETGEMCEAVCGFDFGLLSGFTTFVHQGAEHSFILMHSRAAGATRTTMPRNWPEPPRDGFVMLKGNATGAAPLQKLVNLLHTERTRLEAAAVERERNRAAWEAAKNEHPSEARNHTLWLRPHRGSRYLQPEGGAR
jgi:hypothetical protein